MAALRRPKIGLLGLMLKLYDKSNPELRPAQTRFARKTAKQLEAFAEVVFPGVCNTREQVASAMAEFAQADVDLIVTVHLSYAPSLIALPELVRCATPLVLWNTQKITGVDAGFGMKELLENHGMHGVQDLANVLRRAGRQYAVVTGQFADETALGELREWAQAALAVRELRRAKIGLIGFPFQDMGDFGVDETAFLAHLGPAVCRIPLDALAAARAAAPKAELKAIVAADRATYDVDPALSAEEHLASAGIEWALRKVVADMALAGLAIHYEPLGGDPRFGALPFAAASKLLAEGIGFGGEGDVTSAAAVILMDRLCGAASFTEMFTMDFDHNAVLMAHYAEANPALAKQGEKVRLVRRDGWVGSGGISTSLAFAQEPGPATLINVTTGTDGLPQIIATAVEVLDFSLPEYPSPHCKVCPPGALAEFLNAYLRAGGTHHLAIAPGDAVAAVRKVAELAGVRLYEV